MRPTTASPEADRSLEELLDHIYPQAQRILTRHGIPREDAEDLLQESLFALIFNWNRLSSPEAWLVSTLGKRCLLYWRQRRESRFEAVDGRVLETLAGAGAPPQEQAELRHDLNAAFARLPGQYRDVLRLRYGLGWRSSEIAEKLGYESDGMRRLTSEGLVSLSRELEKAGLSRKGSR